MKTNCVPIGTFQMDKSDPLGILSPERMAEREEDRKTTNGDDLSTLAGPGLKTQDQLTAEMVRDFTTAMMIHNNIKPDFDGLHIEVIKDHANRLLAIVVTPVDVSQGKARPRFNADNKKLEKA